MTHYPKKPERKRITAKLTPKEAEKLESYCEETGLSYTDVIRKLIRKHLPEPKKNATTLTQ